MKITYTLHGDYYLPDLALTKRPDAPLGKYGRMRKSYLKQHRKGLYNTLLLTEQLTPHLAEIDKAAKERVEQIVSHMAEVEGVDEELKASDPMKWVRLMNNFKHAAEEIVLQELIYD